MKFKFIDLLPNLFSSCTTFIFIYVGLDLMFEVKNTIVLLSFSFVIYLIDAFNETKIDQFEKRIKELEDKMNNVQ